MSIFDIQDHISDTEVADDDQFRRFIGQRGSGILCVPVQDTHERPTALMPETFRFAKWVKQNEKEVEIDVAEHEGTNILKSADFWMPLVFLAGDISLQMYISIVSSFLYDMVKSSLSHDDNTVHFEAIYQDDTTKKTRKFSYSGNIVGLYKLLDKFNPNDFMDK